MADAPAAAPVETPAPPTAADPAPITATPPAEPARDEAGRFASDKPPEPKAEPAAPPKRWKVKVDGADLEVDEAELLKGYQRASAANKRFEDAVKARQEAEALKQGISKDWRAALKAAGVDPRTAAMEEIKAAIEEENRAQQEAQLPPEVRQQLAEARAAREELAKLKAESEQAHKVQLDAEAKRHYDALQQSLPKAMEAAKLPNTPEAARIVIAKAKAMVMAGVPLDLETAAQAAAEELQTKNLAILRAMSPADIVAAIGEKAYKALLAHSVEQVRGAPKPPVPAPQAQPAKPQRQALTAREWDKEFGVTRG